MLSGPGTSATFGPRLASTALCTAFRHWSVTAVDSTQEHYVAQAPELPKTLTPYPVVANIEFAEGPIFDEDGYLYFVNYGQRGKLGRLAPRGLVESWIDTGGVVNGLKYDGNRGLICADHGAKRVTRIDMDRKLIEVLSGKQTTSELLGETEITVSRAALSL